MRIENRNIINIIFDSGGCHTRCRTHLKCLGYTLQTMDENSQSSTRCSLTSNPHANLRLVEKSQSVTHAIGIMIRNNTYLYILIGKYIFIIF